MSKALTPGARVGRHPAGVMRHHSPNPVLYRTPSEAAESLRGTRPRPFYAPQPVGASHQEILTAKSQLVAHRKSLVEVKTHIANMEAALAKLDPQMVVACPVPGYVDPPERIARAKSDAATGIKTVLTPEDGRRIAAGEMERPKHPGVFFHQIFHMKERIAHFRAIVQHTEGHNDYLEYDLDQLDPQRVCAAKVADYVEPPHRVANAEAAKAAGEAPAENIGV